MTFSESTLELFNHLINQLNVPAGASNFDELARQISTAKRELLEASLNQED